MLYYLSLVLWISFSAPNTKAMPIPDQVDEMYREAPIKNSMFDYVEFTRILKHGAKDLEDQWLSCCPCCHP